MPGIHQSYRDIEEVLAEGGIELATMQRLRGVGSDHLGRAPFVQNLRRGHYATTADIPVRHRVRVASADSPTASALLHLERQVPLRPLRTTQ